VLAGVLFIVVVTTLVDIALHALHVFPPMDQPLDDRLAALATSYRIVIEVYGLPALGVSVRAELGTWGLSAACVG